MELNIIDNSGAVQPLELVDLFLNATKWGIFLVNQDDYQECQ